jgi:hypothetical protein
MEVNENTQNQEPKQLVSWNKRKCIDAHAELVKHFMLFIQEMDYPCVDIKEESEKLAMIEQVSVRINSELVKSSGLHGMTLVTRIVPDTFSLKVRSLINPDGSTNFQVALESPNQKPVPHDILLTVLESTVADLRTSSVKNSIQEDNKKKFSQLMNQRDQDAASDSQI